MSDKALALIFLNLGGEMLYVLDQRLYAQQIQTEKGGKIMQDIVCSMFGEKFLDEIFRPQELCSRKALRTIFEKLAHTSIMRLNESSMDKLFDLMTMALKYQLSLVTRPKELILVTLNHLDSALPFVKNSATCVHLIELAYVRLFKTFGHLNDVEMQMIRFTMLNFFQDLKIKVSVFLKEKVQNWSGTFILYHEGAVSHGCEPPGTIVYYDDQEQIVKESSFSPVAKYSPSDKQGSYERLGDRVTKLGLNVYSSNKPVDTIITDPSSARNQDQNRGPFKQAKIMSDLEANVVDPRAKAQIDLLCKLIGKTSIQTGAKGDFKLNLFNNEEEEFIYNTQIKAGYTDDASGNVISIDASKRNRDGRLSDVMNEFSNKRDQMPSRPSRNNDLDDDDLDDDDIVGMMDRLIR